MARLDVSLIGRFALPRLGAGALLVLMAGYFAPLAAQQPMMEQVAKTPPALAAAAPAKAPATNAAPGLPANTLGQYGNILAPGDQVAHPLKLRIPLPGVGEVKIPSNEEMTMRDKLEQLAKLSDADIRTQLDKWPAYGKMSLRDQGQMLQRIQDFRDYRGNLAKNKAHDMGLLTLTPEQQTKFEKEYWDQRLLMDRELTKQFAPIFKAREQKLQDDLYREFSAMSQGPVAQAPKPGSPPAPKPPGPGAPPPNAAKPTAATGTPPAKPVVTAPATNGPGMPIAQGPR